MTPPQEQNVLSLQAQFLLVLPKIRLHGEIYFRYIRCHDRRSDLVAEMVALAWKWCSRLVERGRDPFAFPTAIASYAARAVKSGRRLCGQESTRDALSPLAQQRQDFAVASLPEHSTLGSNPFSEALADNTQTPPDEQAAFRIDFPSWLATLSDRDSALLTDLMLGERTRTVARRHGLSTGRVSQLRRQFHDAWEDFCSAPQPRTSARHAHRF